jgi:hypothetical protein
MGCRSDYLEPTQREIENSKVLALLKEIETGEDPRDNNFGTGMGESYNNTTQKTLDENTAKLCSKLQELNKNDIVNMSLELQTWWRDHKEADKRHLEEELKKEKDDKAREEALAKLTPYERKLLGY